MFGRRGGAEERTGYMLSIAFGTKAETLERLEPVLKAARVLPQVQATSSFWRQDPEAVFDIVRGKGWLDRPLIVRSSAKAEDSASGSLAGHFESIPDVYGEKALREAIERVVASMGRPNSEDQFLDGSDVTSSASSFSLQKIQKCYF